MGYWRLESRRSRGRLDSVKRWRGEGSLLGYRVGVPLEIDMRKAMSRLAGLASPRTRSLEMWWDSTESSLEVVAVGAEDDMGAYCRTILNMHPGTEFEEMERLVPEWYSPDAEYQVFDVGYRHGHFQSVFSLDSEIVTPLVNSLQVSDYAWLQFVFRLEDFSSYFRSQMSALDARHKEVSRTDYASEMDTWIRSETKGRDHPERGRDLTKHYSSLSSHIAQKMGMETSMLSIRGIALSKNEVRLDFSGVRSPLMEHLTAHPYRWRRGFAREEKMRINGGKVRAPRMEILGGRLLPEPRELGKSANMYVGRGLLGGYHTRRSPPFIICGEEELGMLVHLPGPDAEHLLRTRRESIPLERNQKTGFCLGFESRRAATEYDPNDFFGIMADSAETKSVVLSPEDLQTHLYAVGGTKSGKTTLIRCIAKHMEMGNLLGTFPNAFIMIDPKGSDSEEFLRQCDPESYKLDRVHFLDPIDTRFSVNVLELPPYDAENRDVVVSQYVGYVMQMIEYWYQGSDSFVRLKRILEVLLHYIYSKNDAPTFLDIYEIIIAMQADGREMLTKMFRELGKPDSVLEQAIGSVAGMEKASFEPVLNRVEKFATDTILRHMFCVRKSTVRFDELIEAGSFTVIRLSPLNIPANIITLLKQTLVIKLWFVIQERADRIRDEKERTQVLLALDEFQDLKDLPVIESMLTQARSYKLGLLLAHQNTNQLDDRLFEIITGNAGTQFVGRVSGRDGGRFGDVWEPKYSREFRAQLATQEYHHWTARLIGEGGKIQPMPVQFWPVFTAREKYDDDLIEQFLRRQREKYGAGVVAESMMQEAHSKENEWLKNVPYEPPSHQEWEILCILREKGMALSLKEITADYMDRTVPRDTVSHVLKQMVRKRLLNRASGPSGKYSLHKLAKQKYFTFDPDEIGTAKDIGVSTAAVVRYYLKKRNFLAVAPQAVKKGKYRTDLVAYDYTAEESISVEVESYAEVKTHPEHVTLNMVKWGGLGFSRCDVWSTHRDIIALRKKIPEESREMVRVFVVSEDGAVEAHGAEDDTVRKMSDEDAEAEAEARPLTVVEKMEQETPAEWEGMMPPPAHNQDPRHPPPEDTTKNAPETAAVPPPAEAPARAPPPVEVPADAILEKPADTIPEYPPAVSKPEETPTQRSRPPASPVVLPESKPRDLPEATSVPPPESGLPEPVAAPVRPGEEVRREDIRDVTVMDKDDLFSPPAFRYAHAGVAPPKWREKEKPKPPRGYKFVKFGGVAPYDGTESLLPPDEEDEEEKKE